MDNNTKDKTDLKKKAREWAERFRSEHPESDETFKEWLNK